MSTSANQDLRRAWLFLSIEGRRQYAGNDGYADIPGQVYRFDSFVPNARHVSSGDAVVFRDRSGAVGFAIVDTVTSAPGVKEILRCPVCGAAQIKERTTIQPRYRCRCKQEFDEPKKESRGCTKYEARFGTSYIPTDVAIAAKTLQGACTRFNGQLSIQKISLELLAPFMASTCPAAVDLFGVENSILAGMDANPEGFVLSGDDTRAQVHRQIKARRGQAKFRNDLLARYGNRCLVSGCSVVDVLEAAHIHPYRSDADNDPENGLLLRCDLHTLFDVDLLAIQPRTLTVQIDPRAAVGDYQEYNGRRLNCGDAGPSDDALQFRWSLYQARQS